VCHKVRSARLKRRKLKLKSRRTVWDVADDLDRREASSYCSYQIREVSGLFLVGLTAGSHLLVVRARPIKKGVDAYSRSGASNRLQVIRGGKTVIDSQRFRKDVESNFQALVSEFREVGCIPCKPDAGRFKRLADLENGESSGTPCILER
jgi:hypothetical protein